MKIRFKRLEYGGSGLEKRFKNDFETSTFLEKTYPDLSDGVTGTLKEIHLNNIYVLHESYNNLEDSSIEIEQNCSCFLLQFIIDGKLTLELNNDSQQQFNLKNNKYYLFYLPASSYSYQNLNSKKNILNIYFTQSFLDKKMGEEFTNNLKKQIEIRKGHPLCTLLKKDLLLNKKLRNIVNEVTNCTFDGAMRKSYLELKLTELLLIALVPDNSKERTDTIRKEDQETLINIESYIRTHLKKELTIEQLSVLAGFNTFKFKNIFKQVYGMPVFKYITSLRIEKAIELISKYDYTVSQASYEVGYKNPQHFTVAFKKKLGYLPSQLIKKG